MRTLKTYRPKTLWPIAMVLGLSLFGFLLGSVRSAEASVRACALFLRKAQVWELRAAEVGAVVRRIRPSEHFEIFLTDYFAAKAALAESGYDSRFLSALSSGKQLAALEFKIHEAMHADPGIEKILREGTLRERMRIFRLAGGVDPGRFGMSEPGLEAWMQQLWRLTGQPRFHLLDWFRAGHKAKLREVFKAQIRNDLAKRGLSAFLDEELRTTWPTVRERARRFFFTRPEGQILLAVATNLQLPNGFLGYVPVIRPNLLGKISEDLLMKIVRDGPDSHWDELVRVAGPAWTRHQTFEGFREGWYWVAGALVVYLKGKELLDRDEILDAEFLDEDREIMEEVRRKSEEFGRQINQAEG